MDSLLGLQLAQGSLANMNPLFKFGENKLVGDTLETIWDHSGQYVYLSSAQQVTVSSSSSSDTNMTITVQGLDADYNEISEDVSVAGRAPTTTDASFLRVFRAFYKSGDSLVGDIYIGTGTLTDGVPANVLAVVKADRGQTMMALYAVPAGYTMYILKAHVSSGTESGTRYIKASIRQKLQGGNQWRTMVSQTLKDNSVEFDFGVPQKVLEKTDVEVVALSSSSTNAVTADWTAVLVKNA